VCSKLGIDKCNRTVVRKRADSLGVSVDSVKVKSIPLDIMLNAINSSKTFHEVKKKVGKSIKYIRNFIARHM
jgi:hypothetical protein